MATWVAWMRRGSAALGMTLAALATAGAGPARADVAIGRTAIPIDGDRVALDAWNGTAAFSLFDEAASVYRLAVSRSGSAPETLPLAPQPTPFELDVGPGPDGQATLVYSRCSGGGGPEWGSHCDLYRYSFADLSETPIAGANTPAEETAPTIWNGQIAFARVPSRDPAKHSMPRILTRPLAAPASQPSRRLSGLPARECVGERARCVKTTFGRVHELELQGRRLAMVVDVGPGIGENPDVEVRLVSLGGRSRRIGRMQPGVISVRKTFLGLSFERGALSFTRVLYYGGDSVFRYDLARRRYTAASLGRDTYGLALHSANRYYLAQSCRSDCPRFPPFIGAPPGVPPTALSLRLSITDPLRFAATSPPVRPRPR